MVVVTNNSANLTASTKTANLLASTDLSQLAEDSEVSVYAVASAAGVNIEFGVGSEKAITDRELVFIGTTLDVMSHEVASFTAPAGANLSLFLRETAAAGTTDVLWRVETTPLD